MPEEIIVVNQAAAPPKRYAVRLEDGTVENVILWDGISEYDPGAGVSLVEIAEDSPVGPGDSIDTSGNPV